MTITVIKNNRFGNVDLLVRDEDQRNLIAGLTRRKTLTVADIGILQALGVTVKLSEEAQDYLSGRG